jgi:RNA-directed DNA polymerase
MGMTWRRAEHLTKGGVMSHLNNSTTPSGDYLAQRAVLQPALNNNLFNDVLAAHNLKRAWKQVRSNKGAAGVDGLQLDDFIDWSKQHWKQCEAQLNNGSYRPSPVRRVEIDKPDGGKRLLGIPTVLDRVIQQAITQILSPIFEPTFSENSFGFRPNRSGHQAVKQVQRLIKQKRRIAVDVDLSKFFDRVNHDLMMSKLAVRIRDKRLLALIGHYLRAGIMDKGRLSPSTEGVPQGGPLSPLLSNILLDSLDKELERRGHQFARYADDCAP